MEKEMTGKGGLFTPAELDYVLCALIRYQTELRGRTHLMERFATPEHLACHRAKIVMGDKLLKDFGQMNSGQG